MSLRFLIFSTALVSLGFFEVTPAHAGMAEDSKMELFAGYSYLHSNTVFNGQSVHFHGASFSGTFHLNSWFGVVGDVGVYHAGNVDSQFSLNVSSFQAGPQIRLPNWHRLTPYAQFLVGGGHAGGTLYTSSLGAGLAPIGTNNSFLYTVGGGVDYRLTNRIGIRIAQAEYLHSEFLNGSVTGHVQNNLRLSTGVIFKFGGS